MANGHEVPYAGPDRRTKNPMDERIKDWVRSLLALMFGGAVCYGFLFSRINNLTLVSSDAFSTIAMAVVLWWFKEESEQKRAKETAATLAAVAPAATSTTVTTPPATVTVTPTEVKP